MRNILKLISKPVFAQTSLGNFSGPGPLGGVVSNLTAGSAPNFAVSLVNKGLSILIGAVTAGAFLYFIVNFFLAGLSWVTAGGDQKKIEMAQKQITMSLVGLVIVVSAIFITQLIGKVLGLGDVLNPLNFLLTIWS